VSLKKIFLKTKFTYKIYLYYNLYIRHKCFLDRKQYSQWGEDLFINSFFKGKNNGIYLDIGCFHPYMYSNTCLLHKKGWSGINIDINQTSIDLFNIVRPKDTNICAAISEKKKDFQVYFDDPFSSANTTDKKFYESLKKSSFKNKKILTVKSKTIQEIVDISKIKSVIDFINIDAEGSDFEILQQINLNKYKVKLLSIETHNVDGSKTEHFDFMKNFLEKYNYFIFKRAGPTTLFALNGHNSADG
jgi:FkbM family methyltransferase